MSPKDKKITIILLLIGWIVLIYSTSLYFFTFNGHLASLDETTWRAWQLLLDSQCGSNNIFCHFFYGNYSAEYGGWPSMNFIILLLVGYPFFEILRFAVRDGFTFDQIGLHKLRYNLAIYNILFASLIMILLHSIVLKIHSTGIIAYVVGQCVVFTAIYFGLKRSSLTRDGNYQNE